MVSADAATVDLSAAARDDKSILERTGQEVILYRLRCAQTGNGLSHYYMYGDIPEDAALL